MKMPKRLLPPNYFIINKKIDVEHSPVKDLKRAFIDGGNVQYYEIGNTIFRTKSHYTESENQYTLKDRVNAIIDREIS